MTTRVLSFDPGLTYAGWAIGDFDLATQQLYIQDYGVMEPSKDLDRKIMRSYVGECSRRVMTLMATREMISDLYYTYRPEYICSEDAFFNRFRPMAYGALLQWITTVELFLWDNYKIKLYKFPPKTIKHAVSTGCAGKLDVQKAIRNIPNIHFEESPRAFKEHSADAIACNWTFCHNVLLHNKYEER